MKHLPVRPDSPMLDTADLIKATVAFGQLLGRAIDAGLEHMPAPPVIVSENPMTFAPAVEIPVDTPPQPARLAPAPRTDWERRCDFAYTLRQRGYEPPRPLPALNQFELLDLVPSCCKWPVTDDAPFLFCGAVSGGTYCAKHDAMAYRERQ